MKWRIARNESGTYWQLRGDGKLVFNCLEWREALGALHRLWRGEDPNPVQTEMPER